MISQLPKWVEVGSFILALVAGFINAIGFLSFEHQAVSHLSGTTTLLGVGFVDGTFQRNIHLVGVLVSFLLGAMVSGFLLHGTTLRLGRHYDTALFLESGLLLFSLLLLSSGSSYGHFFASAACGLQNALATTYSGAIVRTTHVTGIFTDLGVMLGEFLEGRALDRRKAKLFLFIIAGFTSGGTLGALVYAEFQYLALLLPIVVCFLLAVIYRVYLRNAA